MKLQIRNMESSRCIAMVKNELDKLGVCPKKVDLGEVEVTKKLSEEKIHLIDIALKQAGFELIINKNNRIIEKTKAAIQEWIYLSNDPPKPNFSQYISNKINHDYNSLSNLFSGVQGVTIEKYIIAQKIERVKELLVYDKLSLSDIAYKMQYSSVAHLSNQFKKVTGLTPSFFKLI
jgi:YesN/AraC family two-component response regulator